MPIQILSPQLANQIAAGEVVERPASVVKELVENSIDAEATNIEIEIDKGGHKRICIRDNGKGIPKPELELALSRHATSKIAKLDDLENISSLGFRGEALASISSVSRLTLTSKPQAQQQAWQACAEGRDMNVTVQPAAHPNGTSIDVLDLFFNTPARRKFLRAEKTEFNHIDEVIRRIALSRFDVAINLKHNGKTVRKYPAIKENQAHIKRISAVCGSDFADHAIGIDSEYEGIKLTGWLSAAGASRMQNDLQYVYVNGRVMKDKLINHAIRQAYEGLLEPNTHPAFVLFLSLDPMQVDVNVHPAKHEVRFHQSRLVHDVIFRSVSKALTESFNQNDERTTEVRHTSLQEVEPSHQYIRPLTTNLSSLGDGETQSASFNQEKEASGQLQGPFNSTYSSTNDRSNGFRYSAPNHSKMGATHYKNLMTPQADDDALGQGTACACLQVSENYLLIEYTGEFYYCNGVKLAAKKLQVEANESTRVMQPLLMPISLSLKQINLNLEAPLLEQIKLLGVELTVVNQRVLLKQVPSGTRALDWAGMLVNLFEAIATRLLQVSGSSTANVDDVLESLDKQMLNDIFYYVLAKHQIDSLPEENSRLNFLAQWVTKQHNIQELLTCCATSIPLQSWLSQFNE